MHCGCNLCSLRCASKASMNFFSLLHSFIDRRFILTVDLSQLSIRFFFFPLIKSSHLVLKGSTLHLLFSICELLASLLLFFGTIIKSNKVTWTQAWWYHITWSDNSDWLDRITDGIDKDGSRLHHAAQSSVQLKTCMDCLFLELSCSIFRIEVDGR